MKPFSSHHAFIRYHLILLVSLLLFGVSCSTDETSLNESEDAVSDPIEDTSDDTSNDEEDGDDTAPPSEGVIEFEQDFRLDATRSVANYILSQSDYDDFLGGDGNITQVAEKAYQYLNDDFDYLIILSVETVQPAGLFYGRSHLIQNQVQGLGASTYDNSAAYGSAGKLKSIIYMPRTEYIANGPFLHEIVHSWGNKGIIPTTVGGHWGFSNTAGQLGGFDEVEDLGNNTYRGTLNDQNGFGTFANGGNAVVYGDLELYTMGLIGADELAPIQVAVNPEWTQNAGEFTADAIETYTAQDLIDEHGARIPSVANSQKEFKALTVVISTSKISEEMSDAVSANLDNFSRQGPPDNSWGSLKNFWLATQGKATFDFTVAQESIK